MVPSKPMASASTSDGVPAAVAQQPTIDYYQSTINDDDAINSARSMSDHLKKQKVKENRAFYKKFENWKSDNPYQLKRQTNIAAYKAAYKSGPGGYGYRDMKADFRDFLRQARGEAPSAQSRTPSDSDSPPLDPYSSLGPAEVSDDIDQYHSPSSQHDLDEAVLPEKLAEPNINLNETGDEAYRRRALLSGRPIEDPASAVKETEVDSSRAQPSSEGTYQSAAAKRLSELKENIKRKRAEEHAGSLTSAMESHAPPPPPLAKADTSSLPSTSSSSTVISGPPVMYKPVSAPAVPYNPTISAPPVYFDRPPAADKPTPSTTNVESEHPQKRQKIESKPKQLTFGERMMAKMGHTPGKGLGKNEDGVTTHIEVKMRKETGPGKGRRQQLDADDMDWDGDGKNKKPSQTQSIFDITGGHRAEPREPSKWGEPSRVVVTWGCVKDINFEEDADRLDGGILQDMGDVFNDKFGRVERIHVNKISGAVYIRFVEELSAMNAVNRFSEGYRFQKRPIRARFYDQSKFDKNEYDH